MQGAIVMLLALSGLGCQNKSADAAQLPTSVSPIASPAVNPFPDSTNPLPSFTIPPPYPNYDFEPAAVPDATHLGVLRSTLSSFCLGHDRDVRAPREIEASALGYESGR